MGDVLNRGTRERPRWYCRYVDVDGKRKQKATHQTTRSAAQRFLAELEARIARGQAGIVELTPEQRARKTITIGELSKRFLDEYAPPHIKDLARYRREIGCVHRVRILPRFRKTPAASVVIAEVEALRDQQLSDALSAASVTQTLAALSKLYSWARRAGLIDCANPVSGCERPRTSHSLDYLSRAEVEALLTFSEANAPELHPMIATGIYTGLRKGELFGLRWSDLCFDGHRLDVNRSYRLLPKSGKPRHVPMNPLLVPTLTRWQERCPKNDEQLVFPVRERGDSHRMGTKEDELGLSVVLAQAGCHVPAKPWHALRHTFAAHAVMSGVSLYSVQQLLGHSSPLMTQRYAHLAPDYLAGEVARLRFSSPPPSSN